MRLKFGIDNPSPKNCQNHDDNQTSAVNQKAIYKKMNDIRQPAFTENFLLAAQREKAFERSKNQEKDKKRGELPDDLLHF